MSKLHLKPDLTQALRHHVSAKSAGWQYVGFQLIALKAGEHYEFAPLAEEESCLTFISGYADIEVSNCKDSTEEKPAHFAKVGNRDTPFADKSPAALYLPPAHRAMITATTDCEIGVSTAPATGKFPVRLIAPESMKRSVRGSGANTRYICDILPESDSQAESLLVVEVITPAGNTSSYPPHRHDEATDSQTYLEETYYHRLNPAQGFAFQRVYTDDRSLDEAMAVEDGDVVLVPRGYHPCATVHGYELYYLNTMAGPERRWQFHNDPAHEWLFNPTPSSC